MYGIVYTLGATRCIILQLATSESLQHALGNSDDKSLLVYGLAVAMVALVMVQVSQTLLHPGHASLDSALASLLPGSL